MTDDDDEAGGRREKTLTVRQKMTQDDKGEGRSLEWSKKDDVIYEQPLRGQHKMKQYLSVICPMRRGFFLTTLKSI